MIRKLPDTSAPALAGEGIWFRLRCGREMKAKWFLGLMLALLMAGCATAPRPQPLTQSDVISMTKAGMNDEDVIRRIEGSGTVFLLGAADVIRLRSEGVSERVVNYMLETYTRAAVEDQRRRDYNDWHFHYGFGYRYGRP